ncbi:MAG: hypothetical protein WCG48_02690 [Candidatus Berkelbacteria bacterium]
MEEVKQKYIFVLGREIELCLAEVKAVLEYFGICFDIDSVSDNIAFINLQISADSIKDLAERLSGTTKIFRLCSGESNFDDLYPTILEEMRQKFLIKDFALSSYSDIDLSKINRLGFAIKSNLKKSGRSTRYIELKGSTEVSAPLSKNLYSTKKIEYAVFGREDQYVFGRLVWAYDPDRWSEIDYGKPRSDKMSGMLPPKLARAMINLALGQTKGQDASCLVIDPFCGSGSVLIEAMSLRLDSFGSDISLLAIEDSKVNIEWFAKKFLSLSSIPFSYIDKIDAKSEKLIDSLSPIIVKYDNAILVGEPYLGRPKRESEEMSSVQDEYVLIKKLYLDFLANAAKLAVKPVICLVFPVVETLERKKYDLYAEIVDEIKKLGYIELCTPLVYGRGYQVVKRQICILQLPITKIQ